MKFQIKLTFPKNAPKPVGRIHHNSFEKVNEGGILRHQILQVENKH